MMQGNAAEAMPQSDQSGQPPKPSFSKQEHAFFQAGEARRGQKEGIPAEGLLDMLKTQTSPEAKRTVLETQLVGATAEERFFLQGELDELANDRDAQIVKCKEALDKWGWEAGHRAAA
ncbi:hypothetical protein EXS71_00360 [Candidatus Uhrbacteria bacterium]|nr:hypothetical protein [Candidatus Uhrbacteria bacterium]